MDLYECQVYAVAGGHPDDGTCYLFSYWNDRRDADKDCARIRDKFPDSKPSVGLVKVYRDSPKGCYSVKGTKYYRIRGTVEEIFVDAPTVESIKAKLTDVELKVLGLSR